MPFADACCSPLVTPAPSPIARKPSKDYKTNNTNFAILISKNFTKPFKTPIEYGKQIHHYAVRIELYFHPVKKRLVRGDARRYLILE